MRRAVVAGVAFLLLAVPGGASAGGAMRAPYDGAYADYGCFGFFGAPPVGDCVSDAQASHDGRLITTSEMFSPLRGRLPGAGSSYAVASVDTSHLLRRATAFVTYTVTVDVNSASASYASATPGGDGLAETYLTAVAWSPACWCDGLAWTLLADPVTSTPDGETVEMTLQVRNMEGGLVSPGTMRVAVYLSSDVRMLGGAGGGAASGDVVVSRIAVARS